jgi:AraC-like DNA-binding protein
MEYINYLRMNKAASLLIDSDLNISEIAMTIGFDDSNYFSRLFKKYKKMSPSEMRKHNAYSGKLE